MSLKIKFVFLLALALSQELSILDVSLGHEEACDSGLKSNPALNQSYQCFSYISNTCCTSNDTFEIKENIEQTLLPLYRSCPGCAYNLKQMQCAAMCSPYQGLFTDLHTIRICKSACVRLYESCKNSKGPNDKVRYIQIVADLYSDPVEFCESNTGILSYLSVKVVEEDCWIGYGPETCDYVEDPVFRGLEDRNSDAADWDSRIQLAALMFGEYKDTGKIEEQTAFMMIESISAFLKTKRSEQCDDFMLDAGNFIVKYAEGKEKNGDWKYNQVDVFITGIMQKLYLKCWFVTEIEKETHIDKDTFFEDLLLEPEIIQRKLAEGALLSIQEDKVKPTGQQITAKSTHNPKQEISKQSQTVPKIPKSSEADIKVLQQDVGKLFKNLYSQLGNIESSVMKAIDGQTVDQVFSAEQLDLPSIIGQLSTQTEEDSENNEESVNVMCFDKATCFAYSFIAGTMLLGLISYIIFSEVNRKERPIALTNIGITLGISVIWIVVVYYFITDSLAYILLLGGIGVPLAYIIAQLFTIFLLISETESRPTENRTDERKRGKKGKRPRAEV